MKATSIIILITTCLLSCRDKRINEIPHYENSQLYGVWKGKNQNQFQRWYFTPDYLYMKQDTKDTCGLIPTDSASYYEYKFIEGKLVLINVGISIGLPTEPPRYSIKTLTPHKLVIQYKNSQLEFDKCN